MYCTRWRWALVCFFMRKYNKFNCNKDLRLIALTNHECNNNNRY